MVDFKITKKEMEVVKKICDRGQAFVKDMATRPYDRMDMEMDLIACHANGCPLDFVKLLKADDFNLMHDIFGIRDHISRKTGKLKNYFLPRCTKQTEKRAQSNAKI